MRKDLAGLRRPSFWRAVAAGSGLLGAVACGSDSTAPARTTNTDQLWSLAFQWPAVNLALVAPYDTAKLVAVPRTVTGAALHDSVKIRYSTKDSAVSVSATGLVTAHFQTAGAVVVAQLTVGSLTLADTAIVQVTDAPLPAPLATLSIQPQAGGLENNHFNLPGLAAQKVVPFFVTIASGDPATDTVCNADGCVYPLVVRYASSDPTMAQIDQFGYVDPVRTGRVTFTVSTLAYGVGKVDSLHATIGQQAIGTTYDTVDTSQRPPRFYITGDSVLRTFPWSEEHQEIIINNTDGAVELTLPTPDHGVHFVGAKSAQRLDTLKQKDDFVRVQFDSVGTYTVRHRLLSTGAIINDVYNIEPYP